MKTSNSQVNKLYIHADVGGEILLAGQLVVDRAQRTGGFKYARAYCRDPRAYALDPINLPLVEDAVYETPITRENLGIAGALLDAGPDDWGKKVLIALLDPPPSNDLEFLLSGSGNGTGALFFTETRDEEPERPLPREFTSLEDVMETALQIDEGVPVSRERAMFFNYGSAIGGTRPKTFIDERYTDPHTGITRWKQWIVKFPRRGELVDQCTLEHASMKMAEEAGVNVANTKLMETALGPVLLVERFDVEANGDRCHLLSSRSLINSGSPSQSKDRESYAAIGRIAKQVSEAGADDNRELFRRMLLNISIGNVDDHLNNHAFRKPPGQKTLQLTPAYDVLPTIGMEGSPQAVSIGPFGGHQTESNIAAGAEEMGIDGEEAAAIAEDVLNATKDWEKVFREAGLTDKEVQIVGKSMSGRQAVQKYLDSIPVEQRRQIQKSSGISMS